MKKILFLLSFIMLFAASSQAQAPALKNDFMSGYNAGDALEKGDQYVDKNDPIRANTWAKANDKATGTSPEVTIPLTYSGYSQEENAIYMDGNDNNLSVYALTGTNGVYGKTPYYLTFLLNYSSVGDGTKAQDIVVLTADYWKNTTRGKLYLKDVDGNIQFSVVVNSEDEGLFQNVATTYPKDATHLVVMKYDVQGMAVSLYVNPDISKPEPETADAISTVGATKDMGNLKGITLRKRTGYEGTIGGFRLADNWTDAVGYSDGSSISSEAAEGKEILNEEYYDVTGRRVDMSQAKGIVIKKTIYTDNTIGIDKVMVK